MLQPSTARARENGFIVPLPSRPPATALPATCSTGCSPCDGGVKERGGGGDRVFLPHLVGHVDRPHSRAQQCSPSFSHSETLPCFSS